MSDKNKSHEPDISCPTYDEFSRQYGGEILRETGDLQIVDGNLAKTRDFDLMLGDKPYDAMRRLLEEWRFKSPHLSYLFRLSALMIQREQEVAERLDEAMKKATVSGYRPLTKSPEFMKAWQAHFDDEAASQSGRDVYPGCIVMMASYALRRFKDDVECSQNDWATKGPIFGGYSVGQILVASANGVRHQDEWFTTYPPNKHQIASMEILRACLGEKGARNSLAYSAGRCEEVLTLLDQGEGFDGFTKSMFLFAHDIAVSCRLEPN